MEKFGKLFAELLKIMCTFLPSMHVLCMLFFGYVLHCLYEKIKTAVFLQIIQLCSRRYQMKIMNG